MPKSNGQVPAYGHHKPSGQARVIINGRHIYLGKYGSPESKSEYARRIAGLSECEVESEAGVFPSCDRSRISINELLLKYWRFAEGYYTEDGRPSGELANLADAIKPLRVHFGSTLAGEFGPKSLKQVRQHLIAQGLSRRVINSRVGRIKRVFKWGVAEELVPPSIFHGLQAVAGLRYGRTEARESKPITPVLDLHVAAVLPFVSPQIAAMIYLQRLTGMRPGEAVQMRPCDFDTKDAVWVYEPAQHKNRWRGHEKKIPIGPAAQDVLKPFLKRDPQAFLFCPGEAFVWRHQQQGNRQNLKRKTPVYPSELRARERRKSERKRSSRKRPLQDRYSVNSYRRAIEYGFAKARKAGIIVPPWHPNQLRHSRATEIRKQFGIEAAQVALGHSRADVTEIYAERNLQAAVDIARKTG